VTLPGDVHPESISRLPRVDRDAMDEQGRQFDDAATGPQSRTLAGLQGPSGIALHSPELGARRRAVDQYLRYETTLDRRLTELAILVTARELDQQLRPEQPPLLPA
jgi:4-carboxymuconolactone decarboxylase